MCIADFSVKVIDAGWCKVFHQSTENFMIGILIIPIIAIIDDILFDFAVIDKLSLDIINGSTVDFKKEMIGETFVINNPKASASCGCGLSFSV